MDILTRLNIYLNEGSTDDDRPIIPIEEDDTPFHESRIDKIVTTIAELHISELFNEVSSRLAKMEVDSLESEKITDIVNKLNKQYIESLKEELNKMIEK
jgi:hypothetical protein